MQVDESFLEALLCDVLCVFFDSGEARAPTSPSGKRQAYPVTSHVDLWHARQVSVSGPFALRDSPRTLAEKVIGANRILRFRVNEAVAPTLHARGRFDRPET